MKKTVELISLEELHERMDNDSYFSLPNVRNEEERMLRAQAKAWAEGIYAESLLS